jgi:hypothetical protein
MIFSLLVWPTAARAMHPKHLVKVSGTLLFFVKDSEEYLSQSSSGTRICCRHFAVADLQIADIQWILCIVWFILHRTDNNFGPFPWDLY